MSRIYDIYKQNLLSDEDNKISKITLDKIMILIENEIQQKDQRIAELEMELEDARLSADFYMKSSTGYTDEFNKLKHENFELEEELAELKENSIVPKFKVGQEVWYTAERGYKPVPPVYCNKVDHIIVRKNGRDEFVLSYKIKHHIKDDLFQIVSMSHIYATEEKAQQRLKELEG